MNQTDDGIGRDLWFFVCNIGLIGRIRPIFDVGQVSNLFRAAIKYDNISNLQRLGYILDNFIDEENKLADSLHKVLEKKKYNLILLSPVKGKKGEIDKKWRVRKNMEIESDL